MDVYNTQMTFLWPGLSMVPTGRLLIDVQNMWCYSEAKVSVQTFIGGWLALFFFCGGNFVKWKC